MDRDELFASIVAACPGRDDIVYLERNGETYRWRMLAGDDASGDAAPLPTGSDHPADVWMSFSAVWPFDEPARLRAFFDDLLAEMESMADTADRCRWPIDEPWPDQPHCH